MQKVWHGNQLNINFPWKNLLLKIFENIERVHYVGQFHDSLHYVYKKDVSPETRSNTSKFGLAKNHQNI